MIEALEEDQDEEKKEVAEVKDQMELAEKEDKLEKGEGDEGTKKDENGARSGKNLVTDVEETLEEKEKVTTEEENVGEHHSE